MKLASFALCAVVAQADLFPNYSGLVGSGSNSWFDASLWQGNGSPSSGDEAWMNTDNTLVIVDSDASIDKLIVARKAQDATVEITNRAKLNIGSLLFLGQYVDNDGLPAVGNIELKSGQVYVAGGELAVGVSAQGIYTQSGGSTIVLADCKMGRYEKPEAIGLLELSRGSMSCNNIRFNTHSTISLDGGALRVSGNRVNHINSNFINSNRIVSSLANPIIRVSHDNGRTILYAVSSQSKLRTGYTGTDGDWFNPSNWPNNKIPSVNDEIWMNNDNTFASINAYQVGMAHQLIIARHSKNAKVSINAGGELYVGDRDHTMIGRSILFVGQYEASRGYLVLEAGGMLTVDGEFSVGVSGQGIFHMKGGTARVLRGNRMTVGRYKKPTARGSVMLEGGTLRVPRLDINGNSFVELRGGVLEIEGNSVTKTNAYINAGKIIAIGGGTVTASYDSGAGVTTVTSTVNSGNIDVAGIESFTNNQVGPIMPQIKRTGLKSFDPAPPLGVHPRIFFSADEIPEIRARLQSGNAVATEAMKQLLLTTTMMRLGRSAHDSLPLSDRRLASGRYRIDNHGLYDTSGTFAELKNGVTTTIASQTNTHRNVLAGVMAIEAFYCAVFDGVESDVSQRANDLAAAMTTWAEWAVTNPSFDPNNRDIGGGQHMAFAYDLLYNFMTEAQRAAVRKCIATMLWQESQFVGITTEPYATQTNWITLNSFVPMMVLAIEGDIVDPANDAGWSNDRLRKFFHDIMIATYKFLTYGWYSSGDPYEGMGKNYQYNNMYLAYAKRGYNFFTHPHVQAYAFDFLVAQMQPYGHFITTYDAIGGSGFEPVLGDHRAKSTDIIGLKYAFPSHKAVNFAYRQFMEYPFKQSDGTWTVETEARVDKVQVRSTYQNDLLSLLIMAPEYDASGSFTSQNTQSRSSLTFAGMQRGLVITNSGYTQDALELQFHVRQDLGGHTMGDRNNILLSGLGRIWLRYPKGYIYETQWTNGILVNGKGIAIAPLDGQKARQPSRLAHFQDEAMATFMTGDATYAYNNNWYWSRRLPGVQYQRTGFVPVTETWNDFRRSDNKIPHSYGNIPFYEFAHWSVGGGYEERIVKEKVNDMKQVYRLAGLVRGVHPYTLVVDDLEMLPGNNPATYQWLGQIPEDLTALPTSSYPPAADPSRDFILQEPSATGNRRLLVRILNADGTQPSNGPFTFDESITYLQWNVNRVAKRLIIERTAQKPRFRILLFPFSDFADFPTHSVDSNGNPVAEWPGQKDTFQFSTQTSTVGGQQVEVTGLKIMRGSQTLIDTNGKVEPMTIRI